MQKECPICEARMNVFAKLTGKLNTANVVKNFNDNVRREDLLLYRCPICSHGMIDNFLDNEFYVDFSVALGGGGFSCYKSKI